MIFSAAGNPLHAADVSPLKPPLAKPSTEEPKSDNPSAKARDAAQQERIDKFIEELGDKDYYVRQRAQNDLSRMSFEAFDALSTATLNDDLEIASRAKYLLQLMRVEWTAKNDPEDVKILLKDYERQPDEIRMSRMHALAVMPQGKGLLALCRLVRFEKSDVLSKIAVIELLQSPSAADPPKGARAETIRKLFEKSNRTSASWMLDWLKLADDPQAITQWNKPIEAESLLLQHSPAETSREIVSGLIHYQIAWMKKQGQTQEAMNAMRRLLDLEKGDLETLSELLDWLVQQKAWKLVDELAARFARNFDSEPVLLYILAQAQKEQGDAEKAEETAHKAFGLNVGREEIQLLNHYFPLKLLDIYRSAIVGREEIQLLNRFLIAQRLSQRGLFPWAKREYEYVIAKGGSNAITTINAQWNLSEMFHDQGEDLSAAKVLEVMLNKADPKNNTILAGRIASVLQRLDLFRKKPADKIIDRTISEIRARKCFFQACHWEQTGDQAKRRECLENALREEPGDVDVLIACYRLPDPTPEYRKIITDLIHQTAEDIRTEIAAEPDNPSFYNEFAWLVGNTEGDFDEALKYSQKSLELSPDNGGLYDTLARVCYATSDYENALKHQQHAAELEPHSGQIAKQLELFKKAREEHKK
jgi:tetratricopeptide (TPR) repeat protein